MAKYNGGHFFLAQLANGLALFSNLKLILVYNINFNFQQYQVLQQRQIIYSSIENESMTHME